MGWWLSALVAVGSVPQLLQHLLCIKPQTDISDCSDQHLRILEAARLTKGQVATSYGNAACLLNVLWNRAKLSCRGGQRFHVHTLAKGKQHLPAPFPN